MIAAAFTGAAIKRVLLRSAITLGVLFVLLWIVAANGIGMALVVPWALARAAPDGWSVHVGTVEGDWRSLLHLKHLSLHGPDAAVTVDELVLEYRLLPLFDRTLDIPRVHVVRPAMDRATAKSEAHTATDNEPGRGMLDRLLAGSPLGEWTLRLGELRIDHATAVLTGPSGVYRVDRADLVASASLSPGGTSLSLDSLAAEMTPPPVAVSNDTTASTPAEETLREPMERVRLRVAAALHDGILTVRALQLHSARSKVTGEGHLLLAEVPGHVDSVSFDLDAEPLDLRDLPIELPPALLADPLLTLHLSASGPPEAVALALEATGPGSFRARGQGTMRVTGGEDALAVGPAVQVETRVGVDLAEWSTSPYAGELAADLRIELGDLRPTALTDLRGTLVHTPPPGAPADILGGPVRVDVDIADSRDVTATLHRPLGPSGASGDTEWIELGTIAAQAEGTTASWQVDLLLDSSSLRGTGSVAWGEGIRNLVIDDLRTRGLDLSVLAERLPSTWINAGLTGQVAGTAIADMVGSVRARIDSSRVAETAIDSLTLAADFVEGSLNGSARVQSDRGRLESDYRVLLTDASVEATVTRLEGSARPDSIGAVPSWTVRGSGAGTWALGETRRATFSLALDSSSVGTLRLTAGTLEGELLGDSVTATMQSGAFLAAPAVLTASASGRATSLDDAVGILELKATRLRSAENDSSLASGFEDSLAVQIIASEPGRFSLDGRIVGAEGGVVALEGTATSIAAVQSFDLTATGTLDESTALLGGAGIELIAMEASGTRTQEGLRSLAANILLTNGGWKGIVADTVWANFHYDSTALVLDTLYVDSNVLALVGAGRLPVAGADSGGISLLAHFDLEPMRGYTERELPTIGGNELAVWMGGTTDSVEVYASSWMTALVHREVRVAGLESELYGTFRPPFRDLLGLVSGAGRLSLDRIVLPDSEVGSLMVSVDGTPEDLVLEASALIDESRRGELGGRIDPAPDGRSLHVERLQLQLDEDEWEMIQPAVLSFREGLALRGFELRAGEQAISFDGGLTSGGVLDVALAMDSTDVGTVADLIGFPRLDGWLGGEVHLTGTRDAPVGTVDLIAGYHEEGAEPTSVHLLVDSDGRVAAMDAALTDPEGGTLTVSGVVPLDPAEEVQLTVEALGFDVSQAIAFIDGEQLTELDGAVDAWLAVSGPLEALAFDGPVHLTEGTMRSPLLGVTWEEIWVSARGEGRSLVVDRAVIETGDGSMALSGTVTVESAVVLDLDASFDDFHAIETSLYQASVSGNLHIAGTPLAPVVDGRLVTESLDVYLDARPSDGGLEDVELTAADFEILRERFGYIAVEEDLRPRTGEVITADVRIEFGRDSWIRSRSSPEMAVAFAGEVEAHLEPGTEPTFTGELTTIADRGYIAQFGKRFSPREGTVTLDGPVDSTRLDLSAAYTVPSHSNPDGAEATILLGVSGTREALELGLSSEPPMENADIVSYIATGRPAASTFALGDGAADAPESDPPGGLAETGAGLAVGQILGSIETAAQTGVGLDVVEIRQDGLRGATLAAGKYLSPRLYVGLAQSLRRGRRDGTSLADQSGWKTEIEFLAFKGLLLNLEGSASALSLFLRGRVVY